MTTVIRAAALLAGMTLLAGCGPSPPAAADPVRGKDALRAALDAWVKGERPESLRSRSPAIHANDPDWAAGARLERYEIKESEGRLNGYDFNCPVTLWIRAGAGGVKQRTVRYTVGTGASLVVLRDVGG